MINTCKALSVKHLISTIENELLLLAINNLRILVGLGDKNILSTFNQTHTNNSFMGG